MKVLKIKISDNALRKNGTPILKLPPYYNVIGEMETELKKNYKETIKKYYLSEIKEMLK